MKTRNAVLWLLAAVAVAGGGWFLSKGAFFAKRPRMESIVVKARIMPIADTIDAEGAVAPFHRVEIKPTMSGRMEKMLVEEGDRVRKGQIIAWMSSADRAAILDSAQAQNPEQVKVWEDTYLATPVIAPLPGLIILSNVVEGQTVDASAVIYAISDRLIVVAQVDESDIGRVHVGMPAQIVLDSYPDRKVMGKVFEILYEGKNVSNVIQYAVKIRLEEVPAYYRSQMTANISFIVSKKEKALLVPADAVRERDGARQVLTPGEDGSEEWRDVEVGIENDKWVEIVDGLQPGDSVVIRQAPFSRQQAFQGSPFASPGGGPGGRFGGRGGGGGGRGRRGG
jgi:membrane fusion protein, macrolide-specific efflux system